MSLGALTTHRRSCKRRRTLRWRSCRSTLGSPICSAALPTAPNARSRSGARRRRCSPSVTFSRAAATRTAPTCGCDCARCTRPPPPAEASTAAWWARGARWPTSTGGWRRATPTRRAVAAAMGDVTADALARRAARARLPRPYRPAAAGQAQRVVALQWARCGARVGERCPQRGRVPRGSIARRRRQAFGAHAAGGAADGRRASPRPRCAGRRRDLCCAERRVGAAAARRADRCDRALVGAAARAVGGRGGAAPTGGDPAARARYGPRQARHAGGRGDGRARGARRLASGAAARGGMARVGESALAEDAEAWLLEAVQRAGSLKALASKGIARPLRRLSRMRSAPCSPRRHRRTCRRQLGGRWRCGTRRQATCLPRSWRRWSCSAQNSKSGSAPRRRRPSAARPGGTCRSPSSSCRPPSGRRADVRPQSFWAGPYAG